MANASQICAIFLWREVYCWIKHRKKQKCVTIKYRPYLNWIHEPDGDENKNMFFNYFDQNGSGNGHNTHNSDSSIIIEAKNVLPMKSIEMEEIEENQLNEIQQSLQESQDAYFDRVFENGSTESIDRNGSNADPEIP